MSTSVEEETRDPQSSPTNPPILLRTGLQCPEDALLALAPAAAQDGARLQETQGRGLRSLQRLTSQCAVCSSPLGLSGFGGWPAHPCLGGRGAGTCPASGASWSWAQRACPEPTPGWGVGTP